MQPLLGKCMHKPWSHCERGKAVVAVSLELLTYEAATGIEARHACLESAKLHSATLAGSAADVAWWLGRTLPPLVEHGAWATMAAEDRSTN